MVAVPLVNLSVYNLTPFAKIKSHLCSELQMKGEPLTASDGVKAGEQRMQTPCRCGPPAAWAGGSLKGHSA